MISFYIPDMHCGACARRIAQALQTQDAQVAAEVDLARRQVRIDAPADAAVAWQAALAQAGHAAEPLSPAPVAAAGGCGCRSSTATRSAQAACCG